MKLLQINATVNSGSTGRIAEDIGKLMLAHNHHSAIAYGRGNRPSESKKIPIGGKWNVYNHVIQTRLLDNHGFASQSATKKLISDIRSFKPDVIGLHNLHGYYLHIGVLFDFLKQENMPVIWTFHDCWPFTGHCTYFDRVDCIKWKTHCQNCPMTSYYPKSLFRDRSYQNFEDKQDAFKGLANLSIVTPSKWLKELVNQSFLKNYPVEVIHNGVNLDIFSLKENNTNEKIVLGVASIWSERKGLADFKLLKKGLSENVQIVLIGLTPSQIKELPQGIKGIEKTDNVEELARWYSKATVFVNPTYIDNFPTTNIEALACGTPVITYDTGGSPESVDENTGIVVEKGNIDELSKAVKSILKADKNKYGQACRKRAEKYFNKEDRYLDYLRLYEKILTH